MAASTFKIKASIVVLDAACAIALITFLLVTLSSNTKQVSVAASLSRRYFLKPPCEEIYVVKEGETLQTISVKCGDPYIVERNPHIQDPDDVFPGLVIVIAPPSN